jgi:hypothetical protein
MEDVGSRLTLLGTANKEFLIPHPRMVEAFERMDDLRAIGTQTRGKPQMILPIIGPSRSGKSKNVETWCKQIAAHENIPENSPHPILHVSLSSKASIKSVAADIIHALGKHGLPIEIVADMLGRQRGRRGRAFDPMIDLKESQVMYAAATALEAARIELLAIDEIHHLVNSDDAKKTAWSVSEALKNLADTGVCPMAVLGTYEARRIISAKNNPQFAGRCTEPIELDPLDMSIPNDLKLFVGYVAALGNLYSEHGIFPEPQRLTREDFLACFYDVSQGVIGIVSGLVQAAAAHAIRRHSDTIDREDLSLATRRWAMGLDMTDHDPWTNGARDLKIIDRRK